MKNTRKAWGILLSMLLSLFLAACSGTGEASKKEEALQTITVEELQNNLEKEDWVVVDTRTNEGFNHPAKEGVERDGQIKGAVAFSTDLLSGDAGNYQLDAILKYGGISADKHVVLYDANGKDAKEVAAFLKEKGFKNLYTFDIKEWAANLDLPMEAHPILCCPE